MVDDLEIPTIGVINGPGFHTEMLLMCDITICSDDTIIYDLHYDIGSVPGDGIHSCFQELLGVKRTAYALLTGHAIDAKTLCRRGGFDRPCLFWKDTMKISGSFVSTDWSKRSRGIVGPRDVIQSRSSIAMTGAKSKALTACSATSPDYAASRRWRLPHELRSALAYFGASLRSVTMLRRIFAAQLFAAKLIVASGLQKRGRALGDARHVQAIRI